MTSAHLRVSAAMKAPKSLPNTVPGSEPSSCMRATMSGALSAFATSLRSFASTGSGVFAGATSPYHDDASKPARPCSAIVGTLDSADGRLPDQALRDLIQYELDRGSLMKEIPLSQVASRDLLQQAQKELNLK